MKKSLFTLLLTAIAFTTACAEDAPALTVQKADGTSVIYAISQITSITYSGSDMVINMSDNTAVTIATDDITKMTTNSSVTGVNELSESTNESMTYEIYDAAGKILGKGTTKSINDIPMPQGANIVKVNGQTIKISK